MEDGDEMDVALDGAMSKRACDSCRTRKIRCDRLVPCSNCKASKLTCITTTPAQKAQRQRVHISEEYEKKIDRIEDRLASIENVLESLASKLSNLDLHRDPIDTVSHPRSSRVGINRSPGTLAEAATPAPFEGETAINSQSDYAREFLAQAIESTPSIGQNAEIRSVLTALGELVSQQGQNSAAVAPWVHPSLVDTDPAKLEKPPWEEVIRVVDKAAKYPTMSFSVIFPFLKMPNLKDIIEDAYHNPGSCGAARRLLAYGVLDNLLTEFKALPLTRLDVTHYARYASQCKHQTAVAISQLDMFMPPTSENIMALLLGAATAIEMCKPSLCWVMVSSAAGLCQNLGYHRLNTMINDSEDVMRMKCRVFWLIYTFDKTLSLRLGRASVIQDWDISLPFTIPDDGTSSGPNGTEMLEYWVKVSRIQGQTYEKLFSPAAFLKPPEERTRSAIELVNGLNQAWFERGSATVIEFTSLGDSIKYIPKPTVATNRSPNETEAPSQRKRSGEPTLPNQFDATGYIQDSFELIQDVLFHSNVVLHYSTCALIQRAVSPDNVTFNQECLESSRAALVAHMRANSQLNIKGNEEFWSGYVHWSILQAPFTPFIVIFCNAIQNTDPTDLDSLRDFVTSLESCRTISEGAQKLWRMCSLFSRVAKLYIIQARSEDTRAPSQSRPEPGEPSYYTASDGTQLDLNAMTEFDPYLSALGLVPNSAWPMAGFSNAPNGTGAEAFSQHHSMGNFEKPDATSVGFGLSGGNQNAVQDWFSGSRYLMNFMEAGDDLQMPDMDF